MELFETIKKRRTIRSYQVKPVENEKLEKIFEAANQAPSAGDNQGYEIVLVEDPLLLGQLWKSIHFQTFSKPSQLALVFCANDKRSDPKFGERGKTLYCVQDATIAAAYAQLAATALGLVTGWLGSFNEDEVRKTIGAPAYIRPVAVLSLGYSAEDPASTTRRSISDLVHRDKY
jgi:nitroreductase